MKLLIALTLLVSSSLSFAQSSDPVLDAVAYDVKSRELDCDWENVLSTMSPLETNYKFVNYLTGLRTEYSVNGDVISASSQSVSSLVRMTSKIVLNKNHTRVKKVDFRLQYFKRTAVNNGTILNPSYTDSYVVTRTFAASCIVR